eukprot:g5275.t1
MGEIEEVEAEVRKFLNGGKNNKALKFLLDDPPVTSKDKDLKSKYAELVFNVMKNIRSEKISVSVGKLDTDQLDVLMKYTYKGLADKSTKSSQFLKWHSEIVKKTGVGGIVRFMADRKTA